MTGAVPKTALVVDDSMLIRHSVCRFLEERGFVVESATNGVEALEVLANFVPDIIITDLSMPRMGGMELVERVRQMEIFASTPIHTYGVQSSGIENFVPVPVRSVARVVRVSSASPTSPGGGSTLTESDSI